MKNIMFRATRSIMIFWLPLVAAALLLLEFATPALAVTPQIAAGGLHTVALKNDGTVWTWGTTSTGQERSL